MSKKTAMERRESNRQHHLTFWERDYREFPRLIANDLFALAALHKRFQEYEHRMKVIDQNRRENAFHMGVSLPESDEKYSFDAYLKAIPEIVRQMLEAERKCGVRFGEMRPRPPHA